MTSPLLIALRQLDQTRSGVPGEHWATFGLGLMLLRAAAKQKSTLAHLALLAAGGLVLWRAASGRDGLRRLLEGGSERSAASR